MSTEFHLLPTFSNVLCPDWAGYLRNMDLICYGINSIILYKLRYYSTNIFTMGICESIFIIFAQLQNHVFPVSSVNSLLKLRDKNELFLLSNVQALNWQPVIHHTSGLLGSLNLFGLVLKGHWLQVCNFFWEDKNWIVTSKQIRLALTCLRLFKLLVNSDDFLL